VLVTAVKTRQVRKEATVYSRCGAAERLALCALTALPFNPVMLFFFYAL